MAKDVLFFDVIALTGAGLHWLNSFDDPERRHQLEQSFYQFIHHLYLEIRRQNKQPQLELEPPRLAWSAKIDGSALQIYEEFLAWLVKEGFDPEKLPQPPRR
jgi:hypothetical protein